MSCSIPCVFCATTFLSSKTLAKHSLQKHGKLSMRQNFFDSDSKEITLPEAAEIDSQSSGHKNYLSWLACVVERINGSHHPKCEGCWFRVDVFQAPEEYARHILRKLNAQVHSVRKLKHCKQPWMVGQSMRFSYQIFEKDRVLDLLQEQKEIHVRLNAAFDNNNILMQHDEYQQDDPLEALKAEERRGRQQDAGLRSSIVIEEGERTNLQRIRNSMVAKFIQNKLW